VLAANAGAEFEWDEANIERLTRHEVGPNEVEQVIHDPHALIVEMQSHPEEERFKSAGGDAGAAPAASPRGKWPRRRPPPA
jgi:uncharacterized DUF497 family protein